jgi:hypothetical protein
VRHLTGQKAQEMNILIAKKEKITENIWNFPSPLPSPRRGEGEGEGKIFRDKFSDFNV